MRKAVEREELRLQYQPIVRFGDGAASLPRRPPLTGKDRASTMTTTPRVALVGTLDTKGAEYHWMADRLSDEGVDLSAVRNLTQDQVLLGGPGADQVQRPLGPAAVEGAAQGLAIELDGVGCLVSPSGRLGHADQLEREVAVGCLHR